ncbi:MAG: protease inhibitor I42 family protein [Candidatus Omnitrophica bacterium]|nr:protease inhibitor I42 family protein [Candidatus Omnitrophota bacterium]
MTKYWKNKIKITRLLLITFLALASLCSAVGPEEDKVIRARLGENFTITLESNATTGYTWEFSKPLDKEFVRLTNTFYETKETGLVGAPGKQVWIFEALKTGTVTIAFEYIRPWDKGAPPEKEESFTILIMENEPERIRIGGDITVTGVNRKGF